MLKKIVLFLIISLVFILVLIYNMDDSQAGKGDAKSKNNRKIELNDNDLNKNSTLEYKAAAFLIVYFDKINNLQDVISGDMLVSLHPLMKVKNF